MRGDVNSVHYLNLLLARPYWADKCGPFIIPLHYFESSSYPKVLSNLHPQWYNEVALYDSGKQNTWLQYPCCHSFNARRMSPTNTYTYRLQIHLLKSGGLWGDDSVACEDEVYTDPKLWSGGICVSLDNPNSTNIWRIPTVWVGDNPRLGWSLVVREDQDARIAFSSEALATLYSLAPFPCTYVCILGLDWMFFLTYWFIPVFCGRVITYEIVLWITDLLYYMECLGYVSLSTWRKSLL